MILFRDARAARRQDDDQGATAVEYAIIASLIAAVIVVVVGLVGVQVLQLFSDMINAWP